MIEVTITKDDGKVELAKIRITNVTDYEIVDDTEQGDYSVQFIVDRCMAVGIHQRSVRYFPRTKYNVLALVLQALNTLDPKELELENGTRPSDMARRFRRALPPFQRG